MIQKIIKVGNSYAITIPKQLATSLGVTDGNVVKIEPQAQNSKMIVDFLTERDQVEKIIDPEVYAVAKDLLKRYLPAFKELAKK